VNAAAESRFEAGWRQPAPRARKLAMALYGWQDPGWVFLFAMLAALPFLLAAAFAPALLSLAPTVEMIAPIADARAIADGAAKFKSANTPFYSLLLLAADVFVETPGRIHLVAKAIAAALVAYPLAYLGSARFPAAQSILLTGAVAAYVTAPFSGPAEISLAFFLVTAMTLVCAPADKGAVRARFEGALAGAGLMILWLLSPVLSLAGFLVLSACPFLLGKAGLVRYVVALAVFAGAAIIAEIAAPGVNVARAASASGLFAASGAFVGESAIALGGVAASTIVVIFAAAVFGGPEHWRGWGASAGLFVLALVAARLAQANAAPVFVFAAALACFSVASPFYEGVFRNHDRASVAMAVAAAALTLFWTGSLVVHSAGQFLLQHNVTKEAPDNIRAELGLVQPGGPTIARWIEEGRFSTPEARELFALAPVDQSAMLLEAAARARIISSYGLDVAILTGADAACVIGGKRGCEASGTKAADTAKVVFVPRLDLDPATAVARGKAEALLYTKFRLVEQGALWDIWVRRGAILPTELEITLGA
jgi:hypothetical protein